MVSQPPSSDVVARLQDIDATRTEVNNPAPPSPGSLQLRPPVLDGGLASSAD
jgi:hypothetical protein